MHGIKDSNSLSHHYLSFGASLLTKACTPDPVELTAISEPHGPHWFTESKTTTPNDTKGGTQSGKFRSRLFSSPMCGTHFSRSKYKIRTESGYVGRGFTQRTRYSITCSAILVGMPTGVSELFGQSVEALYTAHCGCVWADVPELRSFVENERCFVCYV